jgi:hypothetical protein
MKPVKPWYFCQAGLLLVSLLLSTACKKETETKPAAPPACLLATSERGSGIYATYSYDQNKRLSALSYHRPATQFSEEYQGTSTVKRDNSGRIIQMVDSLHNGGGLLCSFEYDAKGRWIKTTVLNLTGKTFNFGVVAEYDTQDRIIRTTRTGSDGAVSFVSTYEYSGGNLVKSIYDDRFSGSITTNQLSYYADKESKPNEYDLISRYTSGSGSASRNLLRQLTSQNQSNTYVTDYSYEFNAEGYPTLINIVTKYSETSSFSDFIKYTYECRN